MVGHDNDSMAFFFSGYPGGYTFLLVSWARILLALRASYDFITTEIPSFASTCNARLLPRLCAASSVYLSIESWTLDVYLAHTEWNWGTCKHDSSARRHTSNALFALPPCLLHPNVPVSFSSLP